MLTIETLSERFQQKKNQLGEIQIKDAKIICKGLISDVSDTDFNSIFDIYLSEDSDYCGCTSFNLPNFIQFALKIEQQLMKISSHCQETFCCFNFSSFVSVNACKVSAKKYDLGMSKKLQIKEVKFEDICPDYFLQFLEENEGKGLLAIEKIQKQSQIYRYNHRIHFDDEIPIEKMKNWPHIQFLHHLWNFAYDQSLQILKNTLVLKEEYEEGKNMIPILEELVKVHEMVMRRKDFKQIFWNRSRKEIDLVSNSLKEIQIEEIVELSQNLMEGMIELFTNPILKLAAIFLSNRIDEERYHQIYDSQVIPVLSRFYFGKKFLPSQQFMEFKNKLCSKAVKRDELDNILLFGKSDESEKILQKYLDQTNDIRKVAIVSVFLVGFSHEEEEDYEERPILLSFIKQYQQLLEKLDNEQGEAKQSRQRIFHEKCCQKQFWRKKTFYTKTLSFNCLNCGENQLFRRMKKKISDKFSQEIKQQGKNLIRADGQSIHSRNHEQFFHYNAPQIVSRCLSCPSHVHLPQCMACLYPLSFFNPYHEIRKKDKEQSKGFDQFLQSENQKTQNIKNALVFCPQCSHGGHYEHVKKWQEIEPRTCIIPNCDCQCVF